MRIGLDTCTKIGDAVQGILKGQIAGLNEAYRHCDGDLGVSISLKLGAADEGGVDIDGTLTYIKEKVKLPFSFKVTEGQDDLFRRNGTQERLPTEGINPAPADLQKQVADDLHMIAEAAARAIGKGPEAIGTGEDIIDAEVGHE